MSLLFFRKLREVFLDSYIEIQNSGQQPTEDETATTTDIETSEIESENGDVVIEDVEEETLGKIWLLMYLPGDSWWRINFLCWECN